MFAGWNPAEGTERRGGETEQGGEETEQGGEGTERGGGETEQGGGVLKRSVFYRGILFPQ